MNLVLACDLGSTGFRAAVVDMSGTVLFSASIAGALNFDQKETFEAAPQDWWRMFCEAVEHLSRQAGSSFNAIEAIAICGITRTQVFLDADYNVLRPAITWQDTRAERWMPETRKLLPQSHPEVSQLSAFHPLARLAWLAREEPPVAQALRAVIEPKDYLNFRLTGECVIDRVSSARLIAATSGPDGRAALAALGYPAAIVPPVGDATAVAGRVRSGLPGALRDLAGRPVVAMGNDTWASVIGLGALRDGYAYNLSGTTEVFGVVSKKWATAEGLMTVDWGDGLTQVGGPSQSGADALVWLLGLFGHRDVHPRAIGAALDSLFMEARGGLPLIFLPYLLGERTPYWDQALRGAFVGLHRSHRPVDCAYAVLEGISYLNRLVLERAEAAIGRRVEDIRFGGGGAANARWAQIKANMCGREVVVPEGDEPGILGGAIAAFAALGYFETIEAGQAAMVRAERRYKPDGASAKYHDKLFELYRGADSKLASISHELAVLQRPV
jgi:xylulokinase